MTHLLPAGSPRTAHARRFGDELTRAMSTRKISAHQLAIATGCGRSAIANWKSAQGLPRLDTARRMADALEWPRLAEIIQGARSRPCDRCGRPFGNESGGAKRFCSPECRRIDEQLRRPTPGVELAATVRAELEQPRVSKRELAAAMTRYAAGESRRRLRVDAQADLIGTLRDAVAAMCAGCEPAGICRTPACALRPVSPLPLPDARPEPAMATAAAGPWGPESAPITLAAIRSANAERWARPGERDRQSERTSAMHAARRGRSA